MYGLKYIIPFKTLSNISCEIRLEEKDFAGEPIELVAGGVPFSIQIDESDLITPVRSSGATIQVFGSDYLQDIYASDPQGVKVTLLVGGVVKWLGYLTPDTFSQDFSSPEFIYEMEAVAAFSTLKYKEFDLTDDFVSFMDIINKAIEYSGYSGYYLTTSVMAGSENLYSLKVSSANFYDELGEPMTYYEVMEEIAKYGVLLTWVPFGDKLYLIDYKAQREGYNSYLTEDGTVTLSDIKVVSDYRGTGAKISRIAGKNKATVNCSLYEIKNLLPEFTEEGATFSQIAGQTSYIEGEYTGIIRRYVQPRMTFFHYAGGNPASVTETANPVTINNAGSSFTRTTEYKTTEPPSELSMSNELQVKTYVDRTSALNGMHLTTSSAVLMLASEKPILVHKNVYFCISLQFKKQTSEYTRSGDRPETYASAGYTHQIAKFRIGNYYYNGTSWTTTPSTFGMKVIYEKGGKVYGQYRSLENTNAFDTGLGDLTGYVFKAPDFALLGECELTLYCIEGAPVSPLRTFGTQYVYYRDIAVDYGVPDETAIYGDWVNKDSKNDLIYENVIASTYVEEADDIELKICTNPDGKLALSSVMKGNDFLTEVTHPVYGTEKPENLILLKMTDIYGSPRFTISPTLKNDAKPYTIYTEPNLGKTFVVAGGEEDVKMECTIYNLIEL